MDYAYITFALTPADAPQAGTSFQSVQRSISHRPKPPVFWFCPWCAKELGRKQDLKRHILTFHLPFWICCPHRTCPWRGSRIEYLKKHMEYGKCGPEPESEQTEQYTIYKPDWILDMVFDDHDTPIPLRLISAELYASALESVLERARNLQKLKQWEDFWGRQPGEISDLEVASESEADEILAIF